MNKSHKIIWRSLLAIYIIGVCVLCFGSFSGGPDLGGTLWGIQKDKIAHFVMFLPFPVLVFCVFDRITTRPWHSAVFVLCTFAAGCMIAAATELGQTLTADRQCDIADFRADMLALAVSSLGVLVYDISKMFRKCRGEE